MPSLSAVSAAFFATGKMPTLTRKRHSIPQSSNKIHGFLGNHQPMFRTLAVALFGLTLIILLGGPLLLYAVLTDNTDLLLLRRTAGCADGSVGGRGADRRSRAGEDSRRPRPSFHA